MSLHRVVLKTRRVPGLRAVYRGIYSVAAAACARSLAALPGVSGVYLHRGMSRDGWEPGVSDVDLLIVLDDAQDDEVRALAKLAARSASLRRAFPMLGDVWIGTGDEARAYLRRGGLRAWEDFPDWRLLAGRPLAGGGCAESAAKRRWLDPWSWLLVSHMELGRRVFGGSAANEKDDADLRKMHADARRFSDFLLSERDAAPAPRSRVVVDPATPPLELWLDSSERFARASRRVLEKVAGPERLVVGIPPAAPGELDGLLAGPARAVVADPPYHDYLLMEEGSSRADYEAVAALASRRLSPRVLLALEPSAWALALQSSYLGAPLGWAGSEGGAAVEDGPLFPRWGARAAGRALARVPALDAGLRRETAAEAASWMLLWWRAMWIGADWSNRFVLHHLCSRAMGLRAILEGEAGAPFCDWELQLARLSARHEDERPAFSRLRERLRREPAPRLDSSDRGELDAGHLPAVARLMGDLRRALLASEAGAAF